MQEIIISNIYLFILATVLAILEIQIEGKNGWAMDLPTWRPKKINLFIKIYKKLMSDREVTGYHITMFIFVLLILHLPYAFGQDLNLINWLMTISLFFIFIILWDFLWFVLNPYHSLKKFNKEHIWWHKKWWIGAPLDYYWSVLLSFVILLPAIFYYDFWFLIFWWVINIWLFIMQTAMVIWFSLVVLKIDNWKK
ncbi:MAG: hypothetical protein WCS88_01630 [Patescibacteria group bacterium]|jgi:hypothetical protein